MQSIYFSHKRKINVVTLREYVEFAEKDCRTLHRDNKWSAIKTDPDSSFYSGDGDRGGSRDDGGHGRGRGCGGRGRGKNRWEKCECYNCGKLGHIKRFCGLPGCGAYKSCTKDTDEGGGNTDGNSFPGTYGNAISRPPRGNKPRHKNLANGDEVVWCRTCSKWTTHFTSRHMTGSISENDDDGAGVVMELELVRTIQETQLRPTKKNQMTTT